MFNMFLMKHFYSFFLLSLIWGWGTNSANAQYLRVKFQNGTEEIKEINSLENLNFPDDLLQINYINGSVDSYELSSIKTFTYVVD